MKPLIDPVPTDLIEAELTKDHFLRHTNNGGNTIYVVTAAQCPNVMREIGRLRELSFRDGGGGTGADVDIDEQDLDPEGYNQLIVWDPKEREIVGGYRFIISRTSHPKCMSTEHYFRFTDRFRNEYLPYTIELDVRSSSPTIRVRGATPRGSIRWTTSGTDWVRWSSTTRTCVTSSEKSPCTAPTTKRPEHTALLPAQILSRQGTPCRSHPSDRSCLRHRKDGGALHRRLLYGRLPNPNP